MDRQHLLDLLADDQLDQLFEHLKKLSPQLGKSLQNQIVLVTGQYHGYLKNKHSGMVGQEQLNLAINKVRSALAYTVGQIPDDVFPTENTSFTNREHEPGTRSKDLKHEPKKESKPDTEAKTNSHLPWILGMVLLLGGIAFLALVKCPTEPQFFGIRLLLALGAAGVATLIPGFLKIENQAVTAGGALAFAVLVYSVNPAKMVASDDCAPKDFTLTVRLEKPDLPHYPPVEIEHFKLWQNNEWKPASSIKNEDLVADFKNLGTGMVGKKVPVQLKAQFWKLASDSLAVSSESPLLKIIPDGSLGTISGRLYDGAGEVLAGATVEVAGLSMTTDEYGKIWFQIPIEKQRTEYQLRVSMAGFETVSKAVYPNGKFDVWMKKDVSG